MKAKQIIGIGLIGLMLFSIAYVGCQGDNPPIKKVTPDPKTQKQEITAPEFSADSAFAYIASQVKFGPRVPNSSAHVACGDWMVELLHNYGAKVIEQKADLKAFDGTVLHSRNIIASFAPENPQRILLCAHWDTRPFGDKDPDKTKWSKPIDGANDGASGVGVLLEMARQFKDKAPAIGVDLIFFDSEDYGTPEFKQDKGPDVLNPNFISSWCLGSQHFIQNPHVRPYNPRFGILLDMVGSGDAMFNKEKYSSEIAADVINLVWGTASKLGYGQYFYNEDVEGVIDDHVMLNRGGLRVIDIIDTRPQPVAMGLGGYKFGGYHHTHNDNLNVIDKNTLKAVGQTLMHVVYNQ
ncbi:MAG: M28 family peptidase [Flavobacteriales bacterium]|nr:M28 family peptidase [Flavobacteriales bacterium]